MKKTAVIRSAFLTEISKTFDLRLSYKDDTAVLSDPESGAFVEISKDEYYTDFKEEETFFEYTVSFSTQHRHFDTLDKAEEYVRMIISDEVLPIEFFDSDRARFG